MDLVDGYPIRVEIPVSDEVIDVTEELGVYLNKNEQTAIKLLRDDYTIEMQNGELIIC